MKKIKERELKPWGPLFLTNEICWVSLTARAWTSVSSGRSFQKRRWSRTGCWGSCGCGGSDPAPRKRPGCSSRCRETSWHPDTHIWTPQSRRTDSAGCARHTENAQEARGTQQNVLPRTISLYFSAHLTDENYWVFWGVGRGLKKLLLSGKHLCSETEFRPHGIYGCWKQHFSNGGLRPKNGLWSCLDWVAALWAVSLSFFIFKEILKYIYVFR